MLQVDYIDNFETKALDTIRDLAEEAECIDIAVAFLSHRGWLELKPSLTALLERGGKLRFIVRRDRQQTSIVDMPGACDRTRLAVISVPKIPRRTLAILPRFAVLMER